MKMVCVAVLMDILANLSKISKYVPLAIIVVIIVLGKREPNALIAILIFPLDFLIRIKGVLVLKRIILTKN
jgi:hypothetical protein